MLWPPPPKRSKLTLNGYVKNRRPRRLPRQKMLRFLPNQPPLLPFGASRSSDKRRYVAQLICLPLPIAGSTVGSVPPLITWA